MYVCVCVRVRVTTRSAAELEGKNVCFVASPSNARVVPSNEKSTIRFDFCYYRVAFRQRPNIHDINVSFVVQIFSTIEPIFIQIPLKFFSFRW